MLESVLLLHVGILSEYLEKFINLRVQMREERVKLAEVACCTIFLNRKLKHITLKFLLSPVWYLLTYSKKSP